MKTKITWTDDEYEKLADIVIAMRLNDLSSSLITLVNKALEQFPIGRRRKVLTVKNVEPLVQLLADKINKFKDADAQLKSLKDKIVSLEMKLDDDELVRLYGRRVIRNIPILDILLERRASEFLAGITTADLAAEAVRRVVAESLNNQTGAELYKHVPPVPAFKKLKTSKIVVIGLLRDQQTTFANLINHAGINIRFIDSTVSPATVPSGADLYVLWTKFISHSMVGKCQSLGTVLIGDKLDDLAKRVTLFLEGGD